MKIEIRSKNEATISGYVNAVERESRVLQDNRGEYVETVAAGTFQKALEENNNVRLYFDHIRDVGGQAEGTLTLKEDNIGLYAEAKITDPEIIEKARANQLRGWSFGFYINSAEWGNRADGMATRKLTDIYLDEVSILDVTPAYVATSIQMRDGKKQARCFHAEDCNIEVIESPETENRSADKENENKQEQEKDGQSEKDMSIFYARKRLEILKLN